MHIIWTIIIGFVAGLIARAIKPGNDSLGWIMTTVLGVAGALVAKFIGLGLGWYSENEPAGFIASVAGAVLLLFIYGLVATRRRT